MRMGWSFVVSVNLKVPVTICHQFKYTFISFINSIFSHDQNATRHKILFVL